MPLLPSTRRLMPSFHMPRALSIALAACLVLAPAAAATPAERGYAEALAMVRSRVDDVSA